MARTRGDIEPDLHRAEQSLRSARERRAAAEQALWAAVRRSGREGTRPEHTEAAVAEYNEATRELIAAEAAVAELRDQLVRAEEREHRLMVVTDALIAQDRTRSAGARGRGDPGDPFRTSRRRNLFDLLRRR